MILFHSLDSSFLLINKRLTKAWLNKVIQEEGSKAGDINIVFCSSDYLLEMNRHFLHHDYFTDVITFPYESPSGSISGDVFIDVETVKTNAQGYHVSFENELSRVMVHGVLHLLGYLDATPEEAAQIHAKEDTYLQLL